MPEVRFTDNLSLDPKSEGGPLQFPPPNSSSPESRGAIAKIRKAPDRSEFSSESGGRRLTTTVSTDRYKEVLDPFLEPHEQDPKTRKREERVTTEEVNGRERPFSREIVDFNTDGSVHRYELRGLPPGLESGQAKLELRRIVEAVGVDDDHDPHDIFQQTPSGARLVDSEFFGHGDVTRDFYTNDGEKVGEMESKHEARSGKGGYYKSAERLKFFDPDGFWRESALRTYDENGNVTLLTHESRRGERNNLTTVRVEESYSRSGGQDTDSDEERVFVDMAKSTSVERNGVTTRVQTQDDRVYDGNGEGGKLLVRKIVNRNMDQGTARRDENFTIRFRYGWRDRVVEAQVIDGNRPDEEPTIYQAQGRVKAEEFEPLSIDPGEWTNLTALRLAEEEDARAQDNLAQASSAQALATEQSNEDAARQEQLNTIRNILRRDNDQAA